MSSASDRLALYIAAEAKILKGQTVKLGDRMLGMPELIEVRKAISALEAQVSAENSAAAKRPTIGGLGYSVARFD